MSLMDIDLISIKKVV